MTPEQLAYVKGELAKGFTPEEVKQTLRTSGYTEDLIGQLFNATQSVIPPATVPQQVVVQKEGPSILKIVLIVIGVIVGLIILFSLRMVPLVINPLNSARDKGEDAATKSTLRSASVSAEIYASDNGDSYKGFCVSSDAPTETYSGETIVCDDSETAYRMYAEFVSGDIFCVDSVGTMDVIDKSVQQPSGLTCN